jgi:hypothetical protein
MLDHLPSSRDFLQSPTDMYRLWQVVAQSKEAGVEQCSNMVPMDTQLRLRTFRMEQSKGLSRNGQGTHG